MGCGRSKGIRDINPPLKPTKTKKRHTIPPPQAFASIDKHALKAPGKVCSSVTSLVKYLVKPCRNDLQKVRAVYRWITENIRYDTHGFLSGNSGPQTPDAVLERRTGICEGYATLFSTLCSEIGIPCKLVSGFSKGFGYDPEIPFSLGTPTDHVWNLVFISGEWRPIETTWGAGYLNSNNKFEKCFEELYFLTDPQDFVINHFPYVEKDINLSLSLQLLEQPVSLMAFNTAICPETKGIEWGFESVSHNSQIITVNKECEITFRTKYLDLQDVICYLKGRKAKKDYRQYVLLRKRGDKFTAKVKPPAEGKYVLELYGKPVGSTTTTYEALVPYIVVCKSTLNDLHPYPKKSGVWGARSDALLYGFTKDIFDYDVVLAEDGVTEIRIKTQRKVLVSFRLYHAEHADTDLKRYVFESYDENTLVIKARFPYVGYYILTLFAKDPKKRTTSLDPVSDILIDNREALVNAHIYPETYDVAFEYGCLLTEPLIGDLPANQNVCLKLRSHQLLRVMVGGEIHMKDENDDFDISFETPEAGEILVVYGSPLKGGPLDGLYAFEIVESLG